MEALEVMGTITDNCDALGLQETQKIEYLDPSKPDIGIRVHYSGGDQCFQMKGHPQIQTLGDQDMEMVPRSLTFDIKCASYDAKEFRLKDNSSCEMIFTIDHSLGCGSAAKKSIVWSVRRFVHDGAHPARGRVFGVYGGRHEDELAEVRDDRS